MWTITVWTISIRALPSFHQRHRKKCRSTARNICRPQIGQVFSKDKDRAIKGSEWSHSGCKRATDLIKGLKEVPGHRAGEAKLLALSKQKEV